LGLANVAAAWTKLVADIGIAESACQNKS